MNISSYFQGNYQQQYIRSMKSSAGNRLQSRNDGRSSRGKRIESTAQEPPANLVAEKREAGREDAKREGDGPPGLPPELSMFVVAALWGSNPACLRYVYMLDAPPSASTLAALSTAFGALLLSLITIIGPSEKDARANDLDIGGEKDLMQYLDNKFDNVWSAGAEVGVWAFIANVATIIGFSQTPASRGAFLLRLTVAFTPLVSKLAGLNVERKEWGSAAIAVLGGILISVDSALRSSEGSPLSVGAGDAILVLAAALWAFQTVRLGRHAQRFEPLTLARNEILVMASCSVAWFAFDYFRADQNPTGALFLASTSPWVVVASVWPGVGPWGIATALQVKAQTTLSAAKTQIFLATDSIWAVGFAFLLGSPDEGFGVLGYGGAACVLLASALSAL